MPQTHYETFIDIVHNLFRGFSFQYRSQAVDISPSILTPYDLLKEVDKPVSPLDKYVATLPKEFIYSARTEMYRRNRGWIDRGVVERRLIRFTEGGTARIVPVYSERTAVGIDSSSNVFVICCFDNVETGIRYLERMLHIPKDSRTGEYKWSKLNYINRTFVVTKLLTILNISCEALIAIHTNFINSDNHLTRNQFRGLIEGCFTGYEQHPYQNKSFRESLRSRFFHFSEGTSIHCDPDFGSLRPSDVVRLVVRNLSRINGRIQPCTPSFATLRSHESLPIQLADLIAGALSIQIRLGRVPPPPTYHLLFNQKRISKKDAINGRWAKGYYWIR